MEKSRLEVQVWYLEKEIERKNDLISEQADLIAHLQLIISTKKEEPA